MENKKITKDNNVFIISLDNVNISSLYLKYGNKEHTWKMEKIQYWEDKNMLKDILKKFYGENIKIIIDNKGLEDLEEIMKAINLDFEYLNDKNVNIYEVFDNIVIYYPYELKFMLIKF